MTDETKKYLTQDIQILSEIEAVRRRPGMYIGTPSRAVEQACREFVANAIDEHLAGHGSTIRVNLTEHGIRISDDGRGIPVVRENGKFDDGVFTTLHTGSSRDNHAPHIHLTAHGCGLAPLNFLAKHFRVQTWGDHPITGERHQWCLKYLRGELVEQTSKKDDGIGTIIEWEPDLEILGPLVTHRGIVDNRCQLGY